MTFPALIAVESGVGDFLMVEGYTRATAYAVIGTLPIAFIVGRSPRMREWVFY